MNVESTDCSRALALGIGKNTVDGKGHRTDSVTVPGARAQEVLKTEGLWSLVRRAARRVRRSCSSAHLFVLAADSDTVREAANPAGKLQELSQRFTEGIEFRELLLNDETEIDALTAADPWSFPRELTVKQMQQGCKLFVALKKGQVLGCVGVWLKDFHDDFQRRDYVLQADEAYYWRAFCIPAYRGLGLLPRLMAHSVECVEKNYHKTKLVSVVRGANRSMLKTVTDVGWKMVGRAGFVQILGIRFQYLWGREAFSETRKRVFLQIANGHS